MSRKRSQRTECLAELMSHSSLLQFSLPQASGKFKHTYSTAIMQGTIRSNVWRLLSAQNCLFLCYYSRRVIPLTVNCENRTYHFLCNPEELRDITDHIPEAVIQTHIRPDP